MYSQGTPKIDNVDTLDVCDTLVVLELVKLGKLGSLLGERGGYASHLLSDTTDTIILTPKIIS